MLPEIAESIYYITVVDFIIADNWFVTNRYRKPCTSKKAK